MDEELVIDDMLSQLKELSVQKKEREDIELDEDNLQQFLFNHSGKLIKKSVELFEDLQERYNNPTADEMEALAKLVGASSTAIETLNKIYINKEKAKTSVKLKQMEIDSKGDEDSGDHNQGVLMDREELLKQILNEAKVIELVEDTNQNQQKEKDSL